MDRDGVVNYDKGYVHNKNNFKFRLGVLKGLKLLNDKNYYIFIVTNQAGIAKKIFSLNDFNKLHIFLKQKLQTKDIFIDDVSLATELIINENIIFESETSDSVKGNVEENMLSYNFLSVLLLPRQPLPGRAIKKLSKYTHLLY